MGVNNLEGEVPFPTLESVNCLPARLSVTRSCCSWRFPRAKEQTGAPQRRFLLARAAQGRLLRLVRICCCCGRKGTTKLVGGSCPVPSASARPMKT